MQRLRRHALKLNKVGRKVLLDNAKSLAANEDMTRRFVEDEKTGALRYNNPDPEALNDGGETEEN